MNNLGCLQLIEQINQEEQQKQRLLQEKARQRQVTYLQLLKVYLFILVGTTAAATTANGWMESATLSS